ncbi:hypothetical protein EVG20_g8094 [Dentipellis fragilis]|uniref:Fungal-type protein kinase domain-containing protein n=1 Tax=Dentipellis fragilis TaxID=205917 RepID=A0A4Y9Y8A5_9AGAM|nr:hypothetical protein EVG20_g8094 [Dentipellis fragilis]
MALLSNHSYSEEKSLYLELCEDMEKQFLGPMPVEAFLDAFVPEAMTPRPSTSVGNVFKNINFPTKSRGKKRKRKGSKKKQIDAVNASRLCPDLEFFNTAARDGEQYPSDRKPDISICNNPRAPSERTSSSTFSSSPSNATHKPRGRSNTAAADWHRMELCIGCLTHEQDRAFSDTSHAEDDLGFEKYSVLEPVEARGRLVAYAAAHMSFHGAIVTERFDFTKDGEYLAEFLWRFNHLSYAQRGHDPSVVAASAAEKALADEHGLNGDIHKSQSLTECKLVVTGRASFGDIALDLQTKKKVWLKDLWRIALDEIERNRAHREAGGRAMARGSERRGDGTTPCPPVPVALASVRDGYASTHLPGSAFGSQRLSVASLGVSLVRVCAGRAVASADYAARGEGAGVWLADTLAFSSVLLCQMKCFASASEGMVNSRLLEDARP